MAEERLAQHCRGGVRAWQFQVWPQTKGTPPAQLRGHVQG